MQTTAIRTVANSLPQNEVILLTLLISKRYIPYTDLQKSLIIWLCFLPVAILNGGLREYILVKVIGEEWALPVSGMILSVCIFLITWMLLPRMIKAITSKESWLIGINWMLLTIAFEFSVGLAGGNTVVKLLATYNPLDGNLWLLVLAATLLSPIIVKHMHNTIQ